jgi:hypothetical protein
MCGHLTKPPFHVVRSLRSVLLKMLVDDEHAVVGRAGSDTGQVGIHLSFAP